MISKQQSALTKIITASVVVITCLALLLTTPSLYNGMHALNRDNTIKRASSWNVSPFQIEFNNWTGHPWIQAHSGTINDPHIIENVTVDCGGNAVTGIQIDNCNQYFIVRNCTVKNSKTIAKDGIYSYGASNGIFRNNTVINCDGWGISISTAIEVSFNIVKNCYGMASFFASNSPVFNNTVINGTYSFFTSGCTNCEYYNNRFVNASSIGLLLQFDNFNNTYRNTTIVNCPTGMEVDIRSKNCTFRGNLVRGASTVGVYVGGDSANNTFFMNRFESNTKQAEDHNGTNKWNNSIYGNYWDNYGSLGPGYVDLNDDGLGDIARYDIQGNTDWHPLWNDGPNPPSIKLITPLDNDFRHLANRTFTVKINDTNLDKMWYTIANGQKFMFSANGTFNGTAWNATYAATPDGQSFLVVFYANDTARNVVSTGLHIIVNHPPTITPLTPLAMDTRGIGERAFVVKITDANLDKMWYTIGSLNGQKFFFTTNGTFDQQAWNATFNGHADGNVFTIYFHANDSAGNETSVGVNVMVNHPPVIGIVVPSCTDYRGINDRAFTVRIKDANLDTMWYTIGTPGGQKYAFTTNGTFDQQAWTTMFDGHANGDVVTIYFHANDTHGEESLASMRITISKPTSVDPWLYLIIFGLVAVAIFVGMTFYTRRAKSRKRS